LSRQRRGRKQDGIDEAEKRLRDPVELNRRLNEGMERLLKLNREESKVNQSSGQEAGQAEAV
jgi:hypothetical protein